MHVYTASGGVLALLATAEICRTDPRPRWAVLWLLLAVLVDASDGPLARRWEVARHTPAIDGRKIDDIVDYLTYTFVPLLLVWRLGWVPEPRLAWVAPALVASLFAFANLAAKDERGAWFLGFPSYWNVVAFYAGIWVAHGGAPHAVGVLLLALAVLSVLPVRFVYPNLAPRPWRAVLWLGGLGWCALLLAMLPDYPRVPAWLALLSLAYPALYLALSVPLARDQASPGLAA